MKVIENEYIVAFDVDDTLVKWDANHTQPHEGSVAFNDPYDNSINHLNPHDKHINLLKKYKGRGMYIIVWSSGGVRWAQSVINTLGLTDYVDLVTTKVTKYVDDLQANEVLGTRVFLDDK